MKLPDYITSLQFYSIDFDVTRIPLQYDLGKYVECYTHFNNLYSEFLQAHGNKDPWASIYKIAATLFLCGILLRSDSLPNLKIPINSACQIQEMEVNSFCKNLMLLAYTRTYTQPATIEEILSLPNCLN